MIHHQGVQSCAWLKLLVVIHRYFVVCLVGVWQCNFEPVVCVYGLAEPYTHTTGSKLRSRTPSKHTTKYRWITTSNFSQAQLCTPWWLGTTVVPSRPDRTHTHTPQVQNYPVKHRPSTRQNICEPIRVIPVKYSSVLPDDGSHKIRSMLEWFLILCLLNFYTT